MTPMKDTTKVALAAAVAGGYVLGRAKKGRLAFAAATYLAGRRFGLDPRQLATEGLRKLSEVPQVAELNEQVRGELMEAGKEGGRRSGQPPHRRDGRQPARAHPQRRQAQAGR